MMLFQGSGNKNWKPNLNDASLATGAGISGIADWWGGGLGGVGGATGTAAGSPVSGAANIESITNLVNSINQKAQQSANAGRIPNALGLEGQSSGNIGNALAGRLDPSVINQIGQQAAERGSMTGSPMGAGSEAAYLKAIGLNSLDLMNTGQNWLTQALGRNPAAPIYNAGNQVLTAGQVQDAILAREQMENNLRIAQIRGARDGHSGGGYRGGGGGGSPIASTGSNWANPIVTQPAPGWNFPPGYNDIPIGGTASGNGVSDEDWFNYWFPAEEDTGGVAGQFDYNFDDAFAGYG